MGHQAVLFLLCVSRPHRAVDPVYQYLTTTQCRARGPPDCGVEDWLMVRWGLYKYLDVVG